MLYDIIKRMNHIRTMDWGKKTPLKISENGRYLLYHDQTPFFYLGDTAWELFHALTFSEMELYFENRTSLGYNVIQAVIIPELDGLKTPNRYGECPLFQNDPAQPNERYFTFIDYVLQMAGNYGLFVGVLPTWGDKVELMGWGIGPVIFNVDNAYYYGKMLGNRYKNTPNIIWIIGGDRQVGGKNREIWEAMAKGIKSEDRNHLMTFHPNGDKSSSMWFHQASWLDFNACQSGHSMRDYPNYMMIDYDYNRAPAKPCLDMEPCYEDHAVNWKIENGFFNDYHVRKAAYRAVFAGACGHVYGCASVWQMHRPEKAPVGFSNDYWHHQIHLPGARQMEYLKRLVESRPFTEREPDFEAIETPLVGDDHIRVTKGKDYLMVYLPKGGEVKVNTSVIRGARKNAWWLDPRTSAIIGIDTNTNPVVIFEAPSSGEGFDWVLVVDNADAMFEYPQFQNKIHY